MAFQSIYRKPIYKGYIDQKFQVEDTSRNSENYFVITNFPTSVGGGKYVFSMVGNPNTLRIASDIDVEILDIDRNPIPSTITAFTDRFNNYYVSFEIYDITVPGVATVTIVGVADRDIAGNKIQRDIQQKYNLKWTGRFNVLPLERNTAEILFDDPPQVGVAQIVIPTRISVSVTQSAYNFSILTSSYTSDKWSYVSTPTVGGAPPSTSNTKVIDPRLREVYINTQQGSSTSNTLPPKTREILSSIKNGTISKANDQFSTIIRSPSGSFTKEMEGGIFSFFSSESLGSVTLNPVKAADFVDMGNGIGRESVFVNLNAYVNTPRTNRYINNGFRAIARGSNWSIIESHSVSTSTPSDAVGVITNLIRSGNPNTTHNFKTVELIHDKEGIYKQMIQYGAFIVSVPNKYTAVLSEPFNLDYWIYINRFYHNDRLTYPPQHIASKYSKIPTFDEFEEYNNSRQYIVSKSSGNSIVRNYQQPANLSIPLPGGTANVSTVAGRHVYTPEGITGFTGSIVYLPPPIMFVTSSVVSSSYVEFTFGDLNPISGQVYRIKTSAKLGSVVGDYKLINDQIIEPVEYLTDAAFPNQTTRGRKYADYRLIGYFESQSLLTSYWTFFKEYPNLIGVVTGSIWSSGSYAQVPAAYTQSGALTTQFNQNYPAKKAFTLTFKVILDYGTTLEVYMNSDPISLYVQTPQTYIRSFVKSFNTEKNRYGGGSNRFGKLVGKLVNEYEDRQDFGSVSFDYETDDSGFGRPVFRTLITGQGANATGSAYITDISIKPLVLNGFTPNILQYAVPLPTEFVEASILSQSIDFKVDYFDFTGKQSEFSTYLNDIVLNYQTDVPSNTCQDQKLYFYANTGFNSSSINTIPTAYD